LWRRELAAGACRTTCSSNGNTGRRLLQGPAGPRGEIFHAAYRTLPGLARPCGAGDVRTAGKVVVDGVADGFFQLRMLQARNPALVAPVPGSY